MSTTYRLLKRIRSKEKMQKNDQRMDWILTDAIRRKELIDSILAHHGGGDGLVMKIRFCQLVYEWRQTRVLIHQRQKARAIITLFFKPKSYLSIITQPHERCKLILFHQYSILLTIQQRILDELAIHPQVIPFLPLSSSLSNGIKSTIQDGREISHLKLQCI